MKKVLFACIFCMVLAALFVTAAAGEEQDHPRLLFLTQPLCPPCVALRSVLDELLVDHVIEVEEINVRENMSVARYFEMTRTPLLVFYNGAGEEIVRREGLVLKEEILLVFKEAGIELEKR